MSRWIQIFRNALTAWRGDSIFKHAAAVSFYTLFSLGPATIVAITVMSFFLGERIAAEQFSRQMTELIGPAAKEMVLTAVQARRSAAGGPVPTAVGVGLLLVGATTVFAQLQNSLNEIWGVRARPNRNGLMVLLLRRLVSFAMVLTMGFLLLVSLILTTTLTIVLTRLDVNTIGSSWMVKGMDFAIAQVLITLLFAVIFKTMPDVELKWRAVWLGAFLTALLFGAGRSLIAFYLGHSTIASSFGAGESLVALLIWVYYSCIIFFSGVEVTRAHHLADHVAVRPKATAVRIRRRPPVKSAGSVPA